jgi:hypothetical protein
LTVWQLAPSLDYRHVTPGWIFSKEIARLSARLFDGQRKCRSEEAIWIEPPQILQLSRSGGNVARLHFTTRKP